jgi:hypothetical protein
MGRLPIHGKPSHTWGVFTYIGMLPISGKSSHTWEDFSHVRDVFSFMGSLPMHGKTSHIWGAFPYLGRLPMKTCLLIYEMSSHILTNTFKTTHCTTFHFRFPHNGSVCI